MDSANVTAEMVGTVYKSVIAVTNAIGGEATARVNAHVKVVSGCYTLGGFNVSGASAGRKTMVYRELLQAMMGPDGKVKPDWKKLKGWNLGMNKEHTERDGYTPAPIDVEVEVPVPLAVVVGGAVVPEPMEVAPRSVTPAVAPIGMAPASPLPAMDQLGALLKQIVGGGVDVAAVQKVVDASLIAYDIDEKVRQINLNGGFPTDRVQLMIKEALLGNVKRVHIIQRDGSAKAIEGVAHERFPDLLKTISSKVNILITGPTGSGKTHAAEQAAKVLGLEFFYNGCIDTEYKLKGFTDAAGKVIKPAFRKAWEFGGVYLFDEVDGSLPGAVLGFNGALSNDLCDFPDGMVRKHKDCIIMATANTWLGGSTFEYVGRMKQDAAFADRFVGFDWQYDDRLERVLCGNVDWVKFVQKVRINVVNRGIKGVIVSPRATMNGERLLLAGLSRVDVIAMTIKKGMTADQWKSVNPDEEGN
jgi:hypothetical protein